MKTSKALFIASNIVINAAAVATLVKDVKNKQGFKKTVKNQLAFTGAAFCTLALVPELNAHINATTVEYLGHNSKVQETTKAVATIIKAAHQW